MFVNVKCEEDRLYNRQHGDHHPLPAAGVKAAVPSELHSRKSQDMHRGVSKSQIPVMLAALACRPSEVTWLYCADRQLERPAGEIKSSDGPDLIRWQGLNRLKFTASPLKPLNSAVRLCVSADGRALCADVFRASVHHLQ